MNEKRKLSKLNLWAVHAFGRVLPAFIEGVPELHVRVPLGCICAWCDEPIRAEDSGVWMVHQDSEGLAHRPWHRECWLRTIVGSIEHQRGECGCPTHCTNQDDDGVAIAWVHRTLGRRATKREEALAAVAYAESRKRGRQ
jgi:hypothetical protein